MRAFLMAAVIFLGGCAGNPLVDKTPCNATSPLFDNVEVHDNGSITLTEDQLEDLLIYIDELEVCGGL